MQNSEAPWWQYQRCVEAGGCVAPGSASVSAPPSREIAVTGLTFSEAEAFCRFLGGRLPTEIEWEYAAKGGDGRRFPWGDVARCPSSSPEEEEPISVARDAIVRRCDDLVSRVFRDGGHEAIDKMGVVLTTWDAARMDRACATAHAAADPLAAFLAELDAGWKVAAAEPARRTCKQSAAYEVGWMRTDHPWGLMGLGGNVMEWTSDAAGAARRAVRGGSFLAEDARGWRTAARASMPEGLRAADVGVRCVRDAAP
jgi:formylglycine-generating enzyme required for sulfatase activity